MHYNLFYKQLFTKQRISQRRQPPSHSLIARSAPSSLLPITGRMSIIRIEKLSYVEISKTLLSSTSWAIRSQRSHRNFRSSTPPPHAKFSTCRRLNVRSTPTFRSVFRRALVRTRAVYYVLYGLRGRTE